MGNIWGRGVEREDTDEEEVHTRQPGKIIPF